MEKLSEIVEKKICEFLGIQQDNSEKQNIDFFSDEILDSFGMMQLITFIEEEFNIKFDEEEIFSNKIKNLFGLIDIVVHKIGK